MLRIGAWMPEGKPVSMFSINVFKIFLRVICGLTQFTTRAHITRATLESVCYQTRDIVEVMARDAGVHLKDLRVDGGMTKNSLLMQLQSDILGIPICKHG